MQGEVPEQKRKTIRLPAQKKSGQPMAMQATDDYVEVNEQQLLVKQTILSGPEIVDEKESAVQRRLVAWRSTVRGAIRSGNNEYCAAWAKWYVALWMRRRTYAEWELPKEDPGVLPPVIAVDVMDGWVVEEVVRHMENEDERTILRHIYVFQNSEWSIKRKLKLRRSQIRALHASALMNLKKILDLVQKPAKIPSNNFHAGNVPRPTVDNDAP